MRNVAVFGAAALGVAAVEKLRAARINVVTVLDNFCELPKFVGEVAVSRPGDFLKKNLSLIDGIVIGAGRSTEIRMQLEDMRLGIPIATTIDECELHEGFLTHTVPASTENERRFIANSSKGTTIVDNKPTMLIASVAHGCNIDCEMCYLQGEHELAHGGSRNYSQMSESTFQKIIPLLSTTRDALITVEGEILMYSQWLKRWMALLDEYPHLHLSLQTNGMLLNDHRIDLLLSHPRVARIAISIDGATPETNDTIRSGAKLEKILQNIKKLVAERDRRGKVAPVIHTHFVMQRDNIHELPIHIYRMSEIGVRSVSARHIIVNQRKHIDRSLYFYQPLCDDFILKTREAAQHHNVMIDIPMTFQESRESGQNSRPPCYEPWRHGQILNDGTVYSCCNNAVTMGNINEPGGFDAVWNNEKYQLLRETVNSPEQHFSSCKYCVAMMPVHTFEAHVHTPLLFALIKSGELNKWCPRPPELLISPDEAFIS